MSTAWMFALRWVMRFIGLVSTIILARLLTPADFGLVAMAMVVVALIDSMATTGVDLALIRDQRNSDTLYNAAWTIQIMQGLLIAIAIAACIPLALAYFQDERLQAILLCLASAAAIQGFNNIGTVAFRKQLEFDREFRFVVYQKLLVFLFTVGLGWVLRDYRALVYAMVFRACVEVTLSYLMHPYRPRLSIKGMGDIWSFSQWLLISRIGIALNEKSAQMIAGRTVEASLLGFYHMAAELGTIFVYEIVMPVRRALFPNLSRIQDRAEFKLHAVNTIGLLALLCFPAGAGVFILAELIIELFLGDQWLAATPVLEWMALFGAIAGFNLSLDLILLVKNKAKLAAARAWLEVAVLIPVLVYVARDGDIEAIAETRLVVTALFVPLMIYFTAKTIQIPASRVYRVMWRPILAAIIMCLVDDFALGNSAVTGVRSLISHVSLGLLTYSVALAALWLLNRHSDSAERVAFDYARKALGERLKTL